MLVAKNLHVRAGKATLLRDVSVQAQPGKMTAIIGPNGAGKSTLLKCLTGENRTHEGTVFLHDADIRRLGAGKLAHHRAVLPQASQLAFPFTVWEVVGLGLRNHARTAHTGSGDNPEAIAAEALRRVGMLGYESRHYQTLSGGEQQRVHLARVLCQVWEPLVEGKARYLFLDEPTSSLDIRHQIDVLELARDYARRGGGVITVLHDLDMASTYADTLIVLSKGALVATGDPKATLSAELLRTVYGLTDAMIENRWPALLTQE